MKALFGAVLALCIAANSVTASTGDAPSPADRRSETIIIIDEWPSEVNAGDVITLKARASNTGTASGGPFDVTEFKVTVTLPSGFSVMGNPTSEKGQWIQENNIWSLLVGDFDAEEEFSWTVPIMAGEDPGEKEVLIEIEQKEFHPGQQDFPCPVVVIRIEPIAYVSADALGPGVIGDPGQPFPEWALAVAALENAAFDMENHRYCIKPGDYSNKPPTVIRNPSIVRTWNGEDGAQFEIDVAGTVQLSPTTIDTDGAVELASPPGTFQFNNSVDILRGDLNTAGGINLAPGTRIGIRDGNFRTSGSGSIGHPGPGEDGIDLLYFGTTDRTVGLAWPPADSPAAESVDDVQINGPGGISLDADRRLKGDLLIGGDGDLDLNGNRLDILGDPGNDTILRVEDNGNLKDTNGGGGLRFLGGGDTEVFIDTEAGRLQFDFPPIEVDRSGGGIFLNGTGVPASNQPPEQPNNQDVMRIVALTLFDGTVTMRDGLDVLEVDGPATQGGGIFIMSGTSSPGGTQPTIQNATIGNNFAQEGGGLWNSSAGTLTITGTLTQNGASINTGGGIFSVGGDATFSGVGGGIFNDGGTVTIGGTLTQTGGSVENSDGGGITIGGDATLGGEEGGGLWNSSTGTMTITGSLNLEGTAVTTTGTDVTVGSDLNVNSGTYVGNGGTVDIARDYYQQGGGVTVNDILLKSGNNVRVEGGSLSGTGTTRVEVGGNYTQGPNDCQGPGNGLFSLDANGEHTVAGDFCVGPDANPASDAAQDRNRYALGGGTLRVNGDLTFNGTGDRFDDTLFAEAEQGLQGTIFLQGFPSRQQNVFQRQDEDAFFDDVVLNSEGGIRLMSDAWQNNNGTLLLELGIIDTNDEQYDWIILNPGIETDLAARNNSERGSGVVQLGSRDSYINGEVERRVEFGNSEGGIVTGGYLFPVGTSEPQGTDDVDFFRPLILQFPDDLGQSIASRVDYLSEAEAKALQGGANLPEGGLTVETSDGGTLNLDVLGPQFWKLEFDRIPSFDPNIRVVADGLPNVFDLTSLRLVQWDCDGSNPRVAGTSGLGEAIGGSTTITAGGVTQDTCQIFGAASNRSTNPIDLTERPVDTQITVDAWPETSGINETVKLEAQAVNTSTAFGGPSPVTGFKVMVTLPDQLALVSSEADRGTWTQSGNVLTLDVGNLGAGESLGWSLMLNGQSTGSGDVAIAIEQNEPHIGTTAFNCPIEISVVPVAYVDPSSAAGDGELNSQDTPFANIGAALDALEGLEAGQKQLCMVPGDYRGEGTITVRQNVRIQTWNGQSGDAAELDIPGTFQADGVVIDSPGDVELVSPDGVFGIGTSLDLLSGSFVTQGLLDLTNGTQVTLRDGTLRTEGQGSVGFPTDDPNFTPGEDGIDLRYLGTADRTIGPEWPDADTPEGAAIRNVEMFSETPVGIELTFNKRLSNDWLLGGNVALNTGEFDLIVDTPAGRSSTVRVEDEATVSASEGGLRFLGGGDTEVLIETSSGRLRFDFPPIEIDRDDGNVTINASGIFATTLPPDPPDNLDVFASRGVTLQNGTVTLAPGLDVFEVNGPAQQGGGIFIISGESSPGGTQPTIQNTTITGSLTQTGGTVENSNGGDITIGGDATLGSEEGGGLWNSSGGTMRITGSLNIEGAAVTTTDTDVTVSTDVNVRSGTYTGTGGTLDIAGAYAVTGGQVTMSGATVEAQGDFAVIAGVLLGEDTRINVGGDYTQGPNACQDPGNALFSLDANSEHTVAGDFCVGPDANPASDAALDRNRYVLGGGNLRLFRKLFFNGTGDRFDDSMFPPEEQGVRGTFFLEGFGSGPQNIFQRQDEDAFFCDVVMNAPNGARLGSNVTQGSGCTLALEQGIIDVTDEVYDWIILNPGIETDLAARNNSERGSGVVQLGSRDSYIKGEVGRQVEFGNSGGGTVTGGYLFPVGTSEQRPDEEGNLRDVDFFRPLILQFPDDLGRSTVARVDYLDGGAPDCRLPEGGMTVDRPAGGTLDLDVIGPQFWKLEFDRIPSFDPNIRIEADGLVNTFDITALRLVQWDCDCTNPRLAGVYEANSDEADAIINRMIDDVPNISQRDVPVGNCQILGVASDFLINPINLPDLVAGDAPRIQIISLADGNVRVTRGGDPLFDDVPPGGASTFFPVDPGEESILFFDRDGNLLAEQPFNAPPGQNTIGIFDQPAEGDPGVFFDPDGRLRAENPEQVDINFFNNAPPGADARITIFNENGEVEQTLDLPPQNTFSGYQPVTPGPKTIEIQDASSEAQLGAFFAEAFGRQDAVVGVIRQNGGANKRNDLALSFYRPNGQTEQPVVVTSIEAEPEELPESFVLHANYPNPFNPTTQIAYELAEPVSVRLTVYDVLGRAVRTLVDSRQQAGRYTIGWDSRNDAGVSVGSGVYLYRLDAGPFTAARTMLLVK